MPTYVYECRACGKVFEIEQRITENSLTDCDCGAKDALRRLIQPVAVAFKGAGFHINDYAAKGVSSESSETMPEPKPTEAATPDTTTTESAPTETKMVESKPAEASGGKGE